jgi:uncharacterized membrane protein YkvA (DUF1232 family)
VRDGFWPKLARNLARLPFAEDLIAAWYCAFDPTTPLRAKAILLGALAYFVMPFDVVPDFLIGIGFTDDLTVLLTAYGIVRSHLKPEHREKAKAKIEELRKA